VIVWLLAVKHVGTGLGVYVQLNLSVFRLACPI